MRTNFATENRMHYAIIAAGNGSRLASEGILQPKPLVRIQGVPMIERLMGIFARNNAESITVIVNEDMTDVQEFVRSWASEKQLKSLGIGRFKLVVKSTPSSMHSFYELSKVIDAPHVCLTTVDTIFTPQDFSLFINSAERLLEADFLGKATENKCDGVFAVTRYIDDEKPLFVEVEDPSLQKSQIIGFHDKGDFPLVSGGIYVLNTRKAFSVLEKCIEEGQTRMRNFQRALINSGLKIEAHVFDKIMDVDHASDIQKAEKFLSSEKFERTNEIGEIQKKRVLLVSRDPKYSPNNVEKDSRILKLVSEKIEAANKNLEIEILSEDSISENLNSQYSVVTGMARSTNAIQTLSNYISESQDRILSYNIRGIQKFYGSRYSVFRQLKKKGVRIPILQSVTTPLWIKKFHADEVQDDDVTFCDSSREVILMQHVHGDLIKVYAVVNGKNKIEFLRWFYPQEDGYTKFGHEEHNDTLKYWPFEQSRLATIAKKIKTTVGLQFFGFDAIIDKNGEIWVIDINDWPSYSKYQDEAAESIARTILSDIKTL